MDECLICSMYHACPMVSQNVQYCFYRSRFCRRCRFCPIILNYFDQRECDITRCELDYLQTPVVSDVLMQSALVSYICRPSPSFLLCYTR